MSKAAKNAPGISPKRKPSLLTNEVIAGVFARVDAVALGLALGLFAGALLLAMTWILLLKGGQEVGKNLGLLVHYIPGYSVSWAGSLVGAIGGFAAGFAAGWSLATLRNLGMRTWMYLCAFWARLDRFLDDM